MIFEVLRGGSNGGGSGPEKAAYMQTPREHSEMMEPEYWPELAAEYNAALALPPGPVKNATINYLRSKAEELESRYPSYWYDRNSNRPKHNQSSSWVGDIDYDPRTREAHVTMGDRIYTYVNVSPDQMGQLLTSPSIGRMLNAAKNPEGGYHNFSPYNG